MNVLVLNVLLLCHASYICCLTGPTSIFYLNLGFMTEILQSLVIITIFIQGAHIMKVIFGGAL